jgi:nucleotide-binding universal stress UspA family protein
MFNTILVADDGSEGAGKGLRLAVDLAKQGGAALHIVCVEEIPDFPETIAEVRNEKRIADRHYRAILRRAAELAETQGVKPHSHLRTGHPVRDIVRLAHDLKADLLVIGATGHSSFYEKVLGTRADRLVDLAPCPVLVAK